MSLITDEPRRNQGFLVASNLPGCQNFLNAFHVFQRVHLRAAVIHLLRLRGFTWVLGITAFSKKVVLLETLFAV